MATINGSIDDRGRPLVRFPNEKGEFLFIIDTGFNGELLISSSAARAMNLPTRRRSTSVELGDGSVAEVFVTRSVVAWLDGSREVQWLVTDDWAGGPDEPVGLIGTALLTPSFLMIDFQARTVEIERQY